MVLVADIRMDLMEQIKNEMKKVYLQDSKPICVGFSGGKDSSLMLTLLWDMLLELPKHLRQKTVHILSANTGVEVPVMEEYLERTLMKIERKAIQQELPIQVHRVKPSMKNNYFVKVLGRGSLPSTPKTKHRNCTHWLKISPMQDKLKELIASAPIQVGEDKTVLTLWLGVRVEESARRAASISNWQLSEESLFARHSDFNEILCFHAVKFVSADELWFYLMSKEKLPYGVSIDELTAQYGEGILDCGLKSSSDQGSSCGGANGRLGCWTCGMVSGNDPMLVRYIAEGKNYDGLMMWKSIMLAMRDDIRYREILPRQQYNRMFKSTNRLNQIDLFDTDETTKYENRFETYKRAEYEQYAPGGMTLEGRRILLEYLLFIQERDGHSLITETEIQAILDAWEDTEGITIPRAEIKPRAFSYDGKVAFLPNKTVNKKETTNPNKVFYVTIQLNKEENELYAFLKERQRVNQTSIFFFSNSKEYKDKKLVWNSAKFVVAKEGITTQLEAAEYVYKWLGWQYGSFTEETKKAAINFLILSALSDGFREQDKKQLNEAILTELLPIAHNEEGQLSFAI